MKKLICLFLLSGISFLAKSINGPTILINADAARLLEGANYVRLNKYSEIPEFISFDKAKQPAFNSTETILKGNFKMSPDFTLRLISNDKDKLGYIHYRYRQYYKNYPVENSMWLVHVRDSRIQSMNGMAFDKLKSANDAIVFTEKEALKEALKYIHAEKYMWQVDSLTDLNKTSAEDLLNAYYPKGELVYASDVKKLYEFNYSLCYKFNICSKVPFGFRKICVNASTGAIVDDENMEQDFYKNNNTGTANTVFLGTQNIDTYFTGSRYILKDLGRNIHTRNSLSTISFINYDEFNDLDNIWNSFSIPEHQYAMDVHYVTEQYYDVLLNTFGRTSWDDNGIQMVSYIGGLPQANAMFVPPGFFSFPWMVYGYNPFNNLMPFFAIDIAGHEMTHGVTHYTAGLIPNTGESGALNESFSDIMGTYLEYILDLNHFDWDCGEDINILPAFIGAPRSMKSPTKFSCPNTYQGNFWDPTLNQVHVNGCVQNYWFYLLSEGGSFIQNIDYLHVKGIGIEKATQIAFRNLTVYLTSTSDYIAAVNGSLQAAIDLYGYCSQEYLDVYNAWRATGFESILPPIGGPTMIYVSNLTGVKPLTSEIKTCQGDMVTLCGEFSYTVSSAVWYRDGKSISGNWGNCLQTYDEGDYYLQTTSTCGSTYNSNTITISFNDPIPDINPQGTVDLCNGPVQLSVINTADYLIQWYNNGNQIANATDPTYIASQPGTYSYLMYGTLIAPSDFQNNTPLNLYGFTTFCDPNAKSTINVSGFSGKVPSGEISVTVNINHPDLSKVGMYLETPGGEYLGLFPCQDNFYNPYPHYTMPSLTYTDLSLWDLRTAIWNVPTDAKPWHIPFWACEGTTISRFAEINGGEVNPNGTWTLHIMDINNPPFSNAQLTSWVLHFPSFTIPLANCTNAYSPDIIVNGCPRLANLQPETELSLMPNPAKQNVTCNLKLPANQKFELKLTETTSRVVKSAYGEADNYGNAKTYFDLSDLSKGVYFIRMSVNDKTETTRKLIIN